MVRTIGENEYHYNFGEETGSRGALSLEGLFVTRAGRVSWPPSSGTEQGLHPEQTLPIMLSRKTVLAIGSVSVPMDGIGEGFTNERQE
ncbi:MAG: hypothetical protein ACJATD_000422 [Alloalcanivorax sp.]|jgi:hypothetical protein